MEYLPGIKITDAAGIARAGLDGPAAARAATESFLLQILKHGFFHADPHPGNIAIGVCGGGRVCGVLVDGVCVGRAGGGGARVPCRPRPWACLLARFHPTHLTHTQHPLSRRLHRRAHLL